jgi:DNA-binding transcriptional regulator YiaG
MKTWTPARIKHLRNSMKLTQEAFAERIGVTRTYVNLMERKVKTPGKTMCILLDCMETKMKKGE